MRTHTEYKTEYNFEFELQTRMQRLSIVIFTHAQRNLKGITI